MGVRYFEEGENGVYLTYNVDKQKEDLGVLIRSFV